MPSYCPVYGTIYRIVADLSIIEIICILYPWLQDLQRQRDPIMKLLHIDSSVLGTNSASRRLTAQIVAEWRAGHPDTVIEIGRAHV